MALKPEGMVKVHFTMPILFRNSEVSGLIIKLHAVIPIMVEMMTAGIKESAV